MRRSRLKTENMVSQRLSKSEVNKDVPAPRTPPSQKSTSVNRDSSRRSSGSSPAVLRSNNTPAIASPVMQQQRRIRQPLHFDTTPEAKMSSKESGVSSATRNHGSTTRKQRQLQKLRDQKLADQKSTVEKRGFSQGNIRSSPSDTSIPPNSARNPSTPPCTERVVRRNASLDSPTVDMRYKTKIPLAPRCSTSPRVHQIIASIPFSRKKQKVESESVYREEESTSTLYINDRVGGYQCAIESENDDTIAELPLLKNDSPGNCVNYEGSGHSSTKHIENDDISSLGMDDSESTTAGTIRQKPFEPIVYKAQSEPSSNIMSLRARRDAKLKYFNNVMTIAKARNEDEKQQRVEERDESSVATENSPLSRVEESSVVRSEAKINSLVEALTVLKQQNLTKTASLTQKLDQLMGSL